MSRVATSPTAVTLTMSAAFTPSAARRRVLSIFTATTGSRRRRLRHRTARRRHRTARRRGISARRQRSLVLLAQHRRTTARTSRPVYVYGAVAALGWLVQSRTRFGFSVFVSARTSAPRGCAVCRWSGGQDPRLRAARDGRRTRRHGAVLADPDPHGHGRLRHGIRTQCHCGRCRGQHQPVGGRGSVLRSVLGALLVGVIRNALTMLNVPLAPQPVAQRIVIVVAITFGQHIRLER